MGGKGSGSLNAAIVKLDGTQIDHDGKVTKSTFFDFLKIPLGDYADLEKEMTAEAALKFRNHVIRMKIGTSAAIPMLCGGPEKCPMGKTCPFREIKKYPIAEKCHPPGTLVKTVKHGDVPIEELDSKVHKLVSFSRKRGGVLTNYRKGFSFSKSEKPFSGRLVSLSTGEKSHIVTPDHICAVRLNEKAVGKFCVYLMRKDNFWKVGKSKVLESSGEEKKYYLPFAQRGRMEGADAMWILGTYSLNTEALLAEEYFSLMWQISKVSFTDCLLRTKSKHEGLYKWATKEQIESHHLSLLKPECFYREKLDSLGLSIDMPIWEKDNSQKSTSDVKIFSRSNMFMRACNLISDIMDVPVYPGEIPEIQDFKKKVEWKPVLIDRKLYSGMVYALDIENDQKTYFANDIGTHNCPVEINLVNEWTHNYVEQLSIDPESISQMVLVNRLVELDLLDYRANVGLSGGLDEEAPSLLKTTITEGDHSTTETVGLHPLLDAKSKFHAERLKTLEALVATPRERYKKAQAIGQSTESDAAKHMAEMSDLIKAMKTQAKGTSLKAIKDEAKQLQEENSRDKIVESDWSDEEF